jgi:cytosine/adenosine deaminase-related metal-dependent hydrolase
MSLLIRNGLIITMNDRFDIVAGDVSVRDGAIVAIGANLHGPHDRVVDAQGDFVIPGLVQTHVHLCQTLFRGYADDRPLMAWLRQRVWPMEAAHTPATLHAAARLATTELLMSGTTSVLTMETVHDTDVVFAAVAESGLRATIGKCMMDAPGDVPARLREDTRRSIDESTALRRTWHGAANGRLRTAFAPRFAVSCTRELLEAVADLSRRDAALVHTHASESREEIAIVRAISGGLDTVAYLQRLRLTSPHLCLAHCVWVDEAEQAILASDDVKVLHCPGSNLKLGSGIAPVAAMRARGITVSLGADGGACNNRLDMFDEMRLTAVLQATAAGPGITSRPGRPVDGHPSRGPYARPGRDQRVD